MRKLWFVLAIAFCFPIAARAQGMPGLAAPQITTHSVTLHCTPGAGGATLAVGFNFYRGGVKINSSPMPTCDYVDLAVLAGQSYTYTARAVDAQNQESTDSNSVSALIPAGPAPLSITTSTLPNGTVSVAYPGVAIVAAGGTPPYSFTAMALPAGVQLAGNFISGQPTLAGTYSPRITVTDAASATAARNYSMTVLPEPPPPSALISLWPLTTTPANQTGNDGASVELGMKFSSTAAGSIVGIRFYKATNSSGTHTGSLWTAAGTRLATGTFTNETGSGWQTLTFLAPVPIAGGLTYTASYHTTSYAWDQPYFNVARTVAPITAPVNAGVYRYGTTSAFPSSVFQASNYWVDVLFLPAGPAPISISVAPTSSTLATGASQQFTATVTNGAAGATWTATGGTISAAGLYTAGSTPGGYSVTARSTADTTKTATASVTITAPPPQLTVRCNEVKAAFTATNMPPGAVLTVTGTADGAPSAGCTIPLP